MGTNTPATNRISIKLFVGYELSTQLKMNLIKDSRWKESSVSQTTFLKKVDYQNKNYIGSYLEFENTTMKNLQKHAKQIKDELQQYCKEIDLTSHKIQIFSQVFIK